jgi:hypothetical protein
VLAVVEHEDRVAAVEGGEQPGERLGHLGAAQVQLGLADGGQHGGRELRGVGERGQLGDDGAGDRGGSDGGGDERGVDGGRGARPRV